MQSAWNKGLTKDSNLSVRKISETMHRKKLDNFKPWRDEMKRRGLIKDAYPRLKKDGDLAELIGVVLGDGHIGKFPRSDSLRITGNFKNQGFTERYTGLVELIFRKKPAVAKVNGSNAVIITIYEKERSKRLGIPHGSRENLTYVVPGWIRANRVNTIRFLRGLYEAEGSLCFHEKTYTHKFLFSNHNESMLMAVFSLVTKLGFHPHVSNNQVQVSRKEEVQKLRNLLRFRDYDSKQL